MQRQIERGRETRGIFLFGNNLSWRHWKRLCKKTKKSTKNRFYPCWIVEHTHIHVRWIYTFGRLHSVCACVYSTYRRPYTSQMVLRCRYRNVHICECACEWSYSIGREWTNEDGWLNESAKKTFKMKRLCHFFASNLYTNINRLHYQDRNIMAVMARVGGRLLAEYLRLVILDYVVDSTIFTTIAQFTFDVYNQMRM